LFILFLFKPGGCRPANPHARKSRLHIKCSTCGRKSRSRERGNRMDVAALNWPVPDPTNVVIANDPRVKLILTQEHDGINVFAGALGAKTCCCIGVRKCHCRWRPPMGWELGPTLSVDGHSRTGVFHADETTLLSDSFPCSGRNKRDGANVWRRDNWQQFASYRHDSGRCGWKQRRTWSGR
jgi:hypothetical protein